MFVQFFLDANEMRIQVVEVAVSRGDMSKVDVCVLSSGNLVCVVFVFPPQMTLDKR